MAAALDRASAPPGAPWILNARWDSFVVLSTIWLPVAVWLLWQASEQMGVPGGRTAITAYLILLSLPHFLTTFQFTYMDVDQRTHYRKKPILYFVIPAVIGVGSWIYCATVGPLLMVSLWLWFGEHHVAAQNLGFASLYRRRNGEGDTDKKIDHLVFNLSWITTIFFYATKPVDAEGLFYLGRPVYTLAVPFRDEILALLIGLSVGAFLLFLGRQLQRRARGERVSVPKLLFMVTTWPSFFAVPFLAQDVDTAVVLRVGYHAMQYLGLTYLLNSRRCRARGPAEASGSLGRLIESGPIVYFSLLFVGAALIWYATEYVVNQPGFANDYSFRYLFLPGIPLLHFFLDGLTWRFSDPHTQKTVVRFLGPTPPEPVGANPVRV